MILYRIALLWTLTAAVVWPAARSVHVIIKNDTGKTLIAVSGKLRHGIVPGKVPGLIGGGDYGEFVAESNGVATGTEGTVVYRLDGINGNVEFSWDNPFIGSNSAGGSAPPGYGVSRIGDSGNRTLIFFSVHKAGHEGVICNPDWVIAHLGTHHEDRLDEVDRVIGFLTTPVKRMGISGWVDTGCDAEAEGWPVRDAQHSTDNFWTIDVKLAQFNIQNRGLPAGTERFVRIEVEPKTPAHANALARENQLIRFHGHVLIDTHHGDELIEVHPYDPMVAVVEPPRAPIPRLGKPRPICRPGFVPRLAVLGDYVCVTQSVRDQTQSDNAQAAARRSPSGGPYRPDTCKQGFVWRGVIPTDHVCVTPQVRAQVADDNSHAAERRAPDR